MVKVTIKGIADTEWNFSISDRELDMMIEICTRLERLNNYEINDETLM